MPLRASSSTSLVVGKKCLAVSWFGLTTPHPIADGVELGCPQPALADGGRRKSGNGALLTLFASRRPIMPARQVVGTAWCLMMLVSVVECGGAVLMFPPPNATEVRDVPALEEARRRIDVKLAMQGPGLTIATAGSIATFTVSAQDKRNVDLGGIGGMSVLLGGSHEYKSAVTGDSEAETDVYTDGGNLLVRYRAATMAGMYRVSVSVEQSFQGCVSGLSAASTVALCHEFVLQTIAPTLVVSPAGVSVKTSFVVINRSQCITVKERSQSGLSIEDRLGDAEGLEEAVGGCGCPKEYIGVGDRCFPCADPLSPWFTDFCPADNATHSFRAGTFDFQIYTRDKWGNAAGGQAITCPFDIASTPIHSLPTVSAVDVSTGHVLADEPPQGTPEQWAPRGKASDVFTCTGVKLVDGPVGGRSDVSAYVHAVYANAFEASELRISVTSAASLSCSASAETDEAAESDTTCSGAGEGNVIGSPLATWVTAAEASAKRTTASVVGRVASRQGLGVAVMTAGVPLTVVIEARDAFGNPVRRQNTSNCLQYKAFLTARSAAGPGGGDS